ncbi:hypothetical protein J1605_015876 [Eschrichtius robustus]|uniref:Uncharacterized protein n=1 Tax=Eschrichtius robustus TaxID=9764 RepID=A0AB34GA55_ESCRO|nr:hypothetical protein J1605_015876 [Eschrichtius robustus]
MGEGFLCVLKDEQDLNRTVACVMAFQENARHTASMWVIGQCKVIGITRLDGSQNLRVNDFNCTTSSGMIIC